MIDTILRTFFNRYLQSFFEPLNHGALEVSFENGVTLKNLKLKPEAINSRLEDNNVDLKILNGGVSSMKILYTGLTGQVTVQLKDLNIQIQPHAMKTVAKALVSGLVNLVHPEISDDEKASSLSPKPYIPYSTTTPYHYIATDLNVESTVSCLGHSRTRKRKVYIPVYPMEMSNQNITNLPYKYTNPICSNYSTCHDISVPVHHSSYFPQSHVANQPLNNCNHEIVNSKFNPAKSNGQNYVVYNKVVYTYPHKT